MKKGKKILTFLGALAIATTLKYIQKTEGNLFPKQKTNKAIQTTDSTFQQKRKIEAIKINARKNFSFIYQDELDVNTNDSVFARIKKDEQKGIEDMIKLASRSIYEESFLFETKNNIWNEIGYNEQFYLRSNKHTVSSIKTNKEIYNNILSRNNNEVHKYHFHPDHKLHFEKKKELSDSTYFAEIQDKVTINEKDEKVPFQHTRNILKKEFENYKEAKPSIADLKTMVVEQIKAYELYPEKKIKHRIVSTHGVTEYGLLHSTKKEYQGKDFRGLILKDHTSYNIPSGAKLITDNRMYILFLPHKNKKMYNGLTNK